MQMAQAPSEPVIPFKPSQTLPDPAKVCLAKRGDDKVSVCERCDGVLDKSVIHRAQITIGSTDKLGNKIMEIVWTGEEYTIYRSTKGIYIHFSDCHEIERTQRALYAEISQILCQLRFLTSQMARFKLLRKKLGYYDYQIVQAMVSTLEKRKEDATNLLAPVLEMAVGRLTNENRVRYLLSCLAAGLIVATGIAFLVWSGQVDRIADAYLVAAIFGSAGATFSIAMSVQSLSLIPCQESMMNVVMGVLRVLIGTFAGALLLLLITVTPLSAVAATLLGSKLEMDPLKLTSVTGWLPFAVVGFIGGFAERLVPNLLQQSSDKIDPAAAAAKDASKKASKGTQQETAPAT
jgi:hypothetical protein